jgi:hypothetical protein
VISSGVAIWVAVLVIFVGLIRRRRRGTGHGHTPGSAAAGAVYDLLNEDKRKAIEIIVEQRAEATDPERARGNLPDLEHPKGK